VTEAGDVEICFISHVQLVLGICSAHELLLCCYCWTIVYCEVPVLLNSVLVGLPVCLKCRL